MMACTSHPMCEFEHTFRRRHEVGTQPTSVTLFLQPIE